MTRIDFRLEYKLDGMNTGHVSRITTGETVQIEQVGDLSFSDMVLTFRSLEDVDQAIDALRAISESATRLLREKSPHFYLVAASQREIDRWHREQGKDPASVTILNTNFVTGARGMTIKPNDIVVYLSHWYEGFYARQVEESIKTARARGERP